MKIKVVLLEPDPEMRHWLGRLLQRTQGFQLLGSCAKAEELADLSDRLGPDLLLVDCDTGAQMGADSLKGLKSRRPGMFVALAGLAHGHQYENRALARGADAFFCKSRAPQSLNQLRQQMSGAKPTQAPAPKGPAAPGEKRETP